MEIIQVSFLDCKTCPVCHEMKTYNQFPISRNEKDGLGRRCKDCHRAYYQENAERIKERVRQHSAKNRELARERAKAWAHANKERAQSRARMYRAKNKEVLREKGKQWRQANAEYISQKHREYYTEHTERIKRNVKAWRKAHYKQSRVHLRHRRHMIYATPIEERLTQFQWESICERYGGKCLCCGKITKLTIDHIVPLTRGGKHAQDNIQPLCRSCNSRKQRQIIDYRVDKIE